jgi:sulfite exporter TauE/SafE
LAANLVRQLTYGLGRIFTYSLCGAAAGHGGQRLISGIRPLADLQAWLSVAAGVALVVLGLHAAGILRRRNPITKGSPCLASTFFAAFLTKPGWFNVFLAGLLNGFLPCGLVYAYLAMAGSSGDPVHGSAIMLLFGLGTIPAMVLAGCGGLYLTLATRRHVFRVAAWCIILTGLLCVMRGLGFIHASALLDGRGCMLCQ